MTAAAETTATLDELVDVLTPVKTAISGQLLAEPRAVGPKGRATAIIIH